MFRKSQLEQQVTSSLLCKHIMDIYRNTMCD